MPAKGVKHRFKPVKADSLVEGESSDIKTAIPNAVYLRGVSLEYELVTNCQDINPNDLLTFYDGSEKILTLNKLKLCNTMAANHSSEVIKGLDWIVAKESYAMVVNHQFMRSLEIEGDAENVLLWFDDISIGKEAIPKSI